MLIFTATKPWDGHAGVIQYNAIQSWLRLDGSHRIVVFGNDAGVAEAVSELGVEHIPDIPLSNSGIPLVGPMFGAAISASRENLIAYVNSDIILLDCFTRAVNTVADAFRAAFLMIGQRHDSDITERVSFEDGWQSRVRAKAREGNLHAPTGVDYFVFTPRTWDHVPPFTLGRTIWDHWLVWGALARRVPVVDATASVLAIHQNHDYSLAGGHDEAWEGVDALANLHLAGRERADCRHATLCLTNDNRIQPRVNVSHE